MREGTKMNSQSTYTVREFRLETALLAKNINVAVTDTETSGESSNAAELCHTVNLPIFY